MAIAGGFYRSEQSMAMGAFYKPADNVTISLSSTLGNSDNMVGVGVSFDLDRIKKPVISGKQYSELKAENSAIKAEIAEIKAENAEIKAQNEEIKAELAELKAMIKAMKDAKQS